MGGHFVKTLKEVNQELKNFKDSPDFSNAIWHMNEYNIDYTTWSDLEIYIYWIESNEPKESHL